MSRLLLAVALTFALLAPADPRAQAQEGPKKVALLVGVDKYLKPGFDDLRFCEADVAAMGAELKKLGFEVTVLLGSGQGEAQATKENIEATTRRLVRPLGKQDVMLLMFSGHGQTLNPDPNANPEELDIDKFESYFCPVDAVYNTPESQVALNFLLDKILAANVGRKLLVLDACRDIPEDRTRPGKNSKGITAASIDVRVGTSVYLSCSFGQRSFEDPAKGHGLFTYCLLEGLRGGAASPSGEVTWERLVAHVNEQMQSPEILQLMPASEPQRPFPAGDLTRTVLGKLDVRPVATTPPPQPSIPPSPLGSGDGGEGLLVAPFTAAAAKTARSETARSRGIPETATSAIGLKLNLIPAGEFLMGGDQSPEEIVRVTAASGDETKAEYHADEQPQHTVQITQPFYLGVYEVTQSQWRSVMGSNPSYFASTGDGQYRVQGLDTSDCPVEQVSWYDCLEFCNKLSARDGLPAYYTLTGVEREDGSIKSAKVSVASGSGRSGYRLPTEAEWEYACRAGTTTPFHFGTQSNGTQSNVDGNYPYGTSTKGPYLERPTSVGQYAANAFGLYDLHGNVWEWCWDWYDATAYASRRGTTVDPVVTSSAEDRRVLRGGGWYNLARNTRSARRNRDAPDGRSNNFGFRVARTP